VAINVESAVREGSSSLNISKADPHIVFLLRQQQQTVVNTDRPTTATQPASVQPAPQPVAQTQRESRPAPVVPQTEQGNSRFLGTWRNTQYNQTIVITNNEFRYSDNIGNDRYWHFTITNWNAIRNQDSKTSTDYPTGYALNGRIASESGLGGYRGATTVFVFIDNNGQRLVYGNNSSGNMMLNLSYYIKQ
jgi:hypothetical protein